MTLGSQAWLKRLPSGTSMFLVVKLVVRSLVVKLVVKASSKASSMSVVQEASFRHKHVPED